MSTNERSIRVLNTDGTEGWTNRKRAHKLVEIRRIALWLSDAVIKMLHDHRVQSATENRIRANAHRALTNGEGFASLAAVEGLPVAGPAIRLFTGRKPATPPREDLVYELRRRFLPCESAPVEYRQFPKRPTPASVRVIVQDGIAV